MEPREDGIDLGELRGHLADLPLALVEWDGEQHVIGYSARAAELFGYGTDEVLGKHYDEIPWVLEEDWPAARDAARELRDGGAVSSVVPVRNRRKDGSIIHCEWYASARHDASGRLVSILSLVLDVTARVRAEEALRASEARARAIAEHVQDQVILLEAIRDPAGQVMDWRYVDANSGALTLIGIGRALLGKTIREVLGPDRAAARHPALVRVLETGTSHRYETRYAGRELLVTLFPVDADRVGSASIDITERKREEEAIRDADRRKGEFLAVLSHELRNPLAPLKNGIEVLERFPSGSPQAARAVDVIRRQTDHLTRLVEDLLDLTRISSGKIQLQREVVDLGALVRRTVEDFGPVLHEARLLPRIELPDDPCWVDVDPVRIAQVVANVLGNAAKFTPPGGAITVRLRAAGAWAELAVHDTGPGIGPEQLARMFEPFAQEPRVLARSRGGLGLGLALSRGLVDAHGGTLRASSEGPGCGAVFTLSLPRAAGPAARPAATDAGHPARPERGRRVLLVDDNEDAARTLADILEALGHEVEVVLDGSTGIARARASRPDVVICDLGLPDLSGYDVAAALRTDPALAGTRLIALSGYGYPEDKQRAREAGFERHFTRPAPLEELEAALS